MRSPIRAVTVTLVLAVAAAPIGGALVRSASATPDSELPAVDMAAVVKAAQIDPRRADDTLTPGAKASVLRVERALAARGLLATEWVDGYFGTKTVEAYATFQQSLGYRGLDATGLPGRTSLRRLGANRFTVTHLIGPGGRVERDGEVVDARTAAMLTEAERLSGRTFTVDQGSYNPGGDPTSAGTHDGGGVVDLSVDGMSATTRVAVTRTLRRVGFAAWVRTPSQGDWPFHIHAVAISDTDLSSPAQHQVGDYYLGRDGLADRAPDDGPKVTIRTWEEYQASR